MNCWALGFTETIVSTSTTPTVRNDNDKDFYSYSSVHFAALEGALAGKWQLLVVVGYRRLYEWLPSAKQQTDRWMPAKRKLNKWPTDSGRRSIGGGGGKSVEPIMPWILRQRDILVAAAERHTNHGTTNTSATKRHGRHSTSMIKSAAYYIIRISFSTCCKRIRNFMAMATPQFRFLISTRPRV
jgi:hypothetical protein